MPRSNGRRLLPSVLGMAALLAVLALCSLAWLNLDSGFGPSRHAVASEEPRDEFERRVRDYLLENPEVIIEALDRLEARQRQAQEGDLQQTLAARAEELLHDPASPIGGNPDGDVTLVYFFDYNCPYCRQAAPMLEEAIQADSSLRMVFKEFPILGPGSEYAARIALAAHRQDAYEPLHDAMMAHTGPIDERSTLEIARRLGLDIERLEEDADDPAIAGSIAANLSLARELRINGTPGFVVGSEVVRGLVDISTLQQAIEQARTEVRR
jgi:protein-disulfide isomerase